MAVLEIAPPWSPSVYRCVRLRTVYVLLGNCSGLDFPVLRSKDWTEANPNMFSACFSAPPCLHVKKHPPTRCNPDPDGIVGVPLCTEYAKLDFPSFQSLPDPKGRNCPAAVLYRKCRSGLLHCPLGALHRMPRRHPVRVYNQFASQKFARSDRKS